MKRFVKSVIGVTLLEIMLVLAIAAMIIVMSVRYYQSATVNQQANAFIAQTQAMVAAFDSLAQATGSYTGITSKSVIAITGGTMNTPWGGLMTLAPTANTIVFTVGTAPTPAVCSLVTARLKTNSHWSTINATCTSLTYSSNT